MKLFPLILLVAMIAMPGVASAHEIAVEHIRSAIRIFVAENRATIEKKVLSLYKHDSCGSPGDKTSVPAKGLIYIGSWLVTSGEGPTLARYEFRSWGISEGRRFEHEEGVEVTFRESANKVSVENWRFL